MKLQKPIKYRLYQNYLWVRSGEDEKWGKGKYTTAKIVTPINQRFGQNLNGFYAELGLPGHNGIDWYAPDSTCLYSPCDGEILQVQLDPDTTKGNGIYILSNVFYEGGKKKRFYIVEWHIKSSLVKAGDTVKAGQLIGFTDNTGKYTTGAHLHEGVRLLEEYKHGMQQISNTGYGYYNDPYYGFFDYFSYIEDVDIKRIDWLKEGQYLQRTDTKNGAVGQFYKVIDGTPKFLDSDKDAISRHIPLVDEAIEVLNKQKLVTAIDEKQWDEIKDLE